MAKTELNIKKQKSKGKKRKHETPAAGRDDEVANKSLIVEQKPQVESEEQTDEHISRKGKASKRKQHTEESPIKEKRSKAKDDNNEENAAADAGEDDEVDDLPTAELLKEAAKPENSNAIVTVRQKKKQKHLQRLEAQKDQSADKEAKRNEEYLRKWKDNKDEWKFVKLRQISIQQTAFDEQKLSAEIWPIALEYLAGSKGGSKTIICKLAEDVIQELDKKCEEITDDSERQSIVESTRYQRARNLLQSFD